MTTRDCAHCGTPITITTRNPNRRYCSPRCRGADWDARNRRVRNDVANDVVHNVGDAVPNGVALTQPFDAESGVFCASSAATYSTSYHRLGGGFGCISRLVSEPVSRMNAGSFKRTCISNSFVLSRPESASLTKHRVVLITGRHCARPPPWGRAESFAVGLLKGLRGRQPYCQRWQ
jgi:endogenous inhibitor of DNA gyrase (YacG/DUF329 family)